MVVQSIDIKTLEDDENVINPNLVYLNDCYNDRNKVGAVLEGGSRSGKTWSSIDFLIWLCSEVETSATINIVKETYNSFKSTLYEDFNRRLPDYGIPSPFANKKEISSFFLFGNKINLLGADSETVLHGVGSDYVYFNESLDISKLAFDQMEQRCRKFWWMDYNPKFTEHWIFDKVTKRKDVGFLKTTLFDNPYISRPEKNKILSYLPTRFTFIGKHFVEEEIANKTLKESEEVAEKRGIKRAQEYDTKRNKQAFHDLALIELERSKQNETEGTADDYMWQVYGEGLRTAPEGLVFKRVKWIKEFPKDIEQIYYGCDIGFSIDPTCIVKVGVEGRNIYLQSLFYQPTESPAEFIPAIKACVPQGATLWADGGGDGLEMIGAARKDKLRVIAVEKFAGSINYGISILKNYKIHIVVSPEAQKEQGNYKYREVNGIRTEDPIDQYNHFWDACRYAAMSNLHLK
jgi:phage terminase large subunit